MIRTEFNQFVIRAFDYTRLSAHPDKELFYYLTMWEPLANRKEQTIAALKKIDLMRCRDEKDYSPVSKACWMIANGS